MAEDRSELNNELHDRTLSERLVVLNGRLMKKAVQKEKEEQQEGQATINGGDSTASELQQLRAAAVAQERALKNKELLNSTLMAKLERARKEKNEEQRKNAQLTEELRWLQSGYDALMHDYRQEQKKSAKVTQLYQAEKKVSAELRKKLKTATEELATDWQEDEQPVEEANEPITSPLVGTIQPGASMQEQLLAEQLDFELPAEMMEGDGNEEQGEEAGRIRHTTTTAVPTGGGVFKCPACPADHVAYSTAELLARHQKFAHGDRQHWRHQCPECGQRCKDNASLQIHMRTHSGEKPHKCRWCGRGFAQRGDLTRHERVHTGERPYVCPVCQRAFSLQGEMTKHARVHSGETPYSCQHCAKQFRQASHCRQHEKTCSKRGVCESE